MTAEAALEKAREVAGDEYAIAQAIVAAYYQGKNEGVDELVQQFA